MLKVIQLSFLFVLFSFFTLQAQDVSTFVWEDLNGNGIQDDAGIGLAGFTVELWIDADMDGTGESNSGIVPSEAGGTYTFSAVPDGDYVIVYTGLAGYYLTQGTADVDASDPTDDSDVTVAFDASGAPTSGSSHTFNFTAATAPKLNVDAGFFIPASVGDYVFEDMDGDGSQGGGDLPLANIDVDLTDQFNNPIFDVFGGAVTTITTGGGGAYNFTDIPPGDYKLTFSDVSGTYYPTKQDEPGVESIDSDIDRTNNDIDFSLISNQIEIEIDAGFFEPVEISDLVWHDLNADGIQDGGAEIGIANIDVDIYDQSTGAIALNMFDVATPTLSTDGAGNYLFDEMPPGEYYLVFTDPAGNYYFTYQNIGAAASDSDCGDLTTGITGQTDPVVYLSGDKNVDVDAGLFLPARIGDFVWEDMNGDGIQDAGEPGLMGINISITDEFGAAVNDVDGLGVGATSSDGAGLYEFTNLRPLNYIVTFDDQVPTYYHTKFDEPGGGTDPTDPTDFDDDSDSDPLTGQSGIIEITSDEDNEYIDAGFFQPCKIGNYVWHDLNGDGIDDGSEPGLDGVTVTLIDANTGLGINDLTGVPAGPELSAGGGLYEFDNLPPGEYVLIFDEPAPYHYTLVDYNGGNIDATDDIDDSDPDKNAVTPGSTHTIELESAEELMDIDAAYYLVTKVGNFVFHDRDWNGIFDGTDVGVDGITVRLFKTDGTPALDFNDIDVSTTVTAGGGMYEFTDLPPGDYYVQGVLVGDWLFTQMDFPAGANDDASDIENDSDADVGTGQTHEFFLESDELTETRVDFGIYKQIDVGGTIFNDTDLDNVYTLGADGTYADVVIQLIAIDVFGFANGDIVATVNSMMGSGEYLFEDIDPGEYKILVVDQNFALGAPLSGTESVVGQEDANNDVDNDDNGDDVVADGSESTSFILTCGEEPEGDGIVNTTIDFGFFVEFNCSASTLSQPSCELVESTITFGNGGDLLCDLNVLGQYCATMPSPPLVGPAPTPLCPNGGGPHNMSWFSFVAGNGTYEIEVVPQNCIPAPGQTDLGVQTGIYTDCTFSEAIICDPNCSTAPVTLSSALLTPGETYFFFLDGCSGSTCDYDVNINGDFSVFQIPEPDPDGLSCDNIDCSLPICPGQELTIRLDGYDDLDIFYTWDIPAGVDILNPNPDDPNLTLENTIDLGFPAVGVYTICMIEATNYCVNTTVPACIEITVEDLQDEVFDDELVCEKLNQQDNIPGYVPVTTDDPNGDGTIGWQGTNPPAMVPGLNTATITTPEGCMYNQSITLIPIPEIPVVDFDTAACGPYSIPDPLGNTFDVDVNVENVMITYPGASVQGCDTTINYTAYILNIDGNITNLGCIGENKVSLIFNVSNVSPALTNPDLNITYTWTDPSGTVVPDTDGNPRTCDIEENGDVTLIIEMEIFGITCEFPFDINVNFDDFLPPPSELFGDAALCDNVTSSSYTATNTDGSVYQWNWTVPSPATIAFGDLSDSIVVNWNGASGGEICVSAVNSCGSQETPTCMNVVLTSSPTADFSLDAEVCRDDETTISFVGTSTAGTGFTWDFGGGVIQGGTTSTEEGPHDVSWSTAGMKMVILNITENGCPAIPDTQFIDVILPPAPPELTCISDGTSITFSWTDTFSVATYTIDLITGSAGVLDETAKTYTVTGLSDGDVVRILVIADNGGLCGAVSSAEAECQVQNCTPPEVNIVIPNDSICIDGTPMTMTITADVVGGAAGTGTFSSSTAGAIDAAGVFDPIAAGPGEHTINYQFVTTQDDCVANASPKKIIIAEIPTSTFDFAPDNICVTDVSTITYTGNNSTAVYDWDFGTDVVTPGSGVGPFDVMWNSAGDKDITLIVTNLFCESTPTTHTVTVDPLLDGLNVNCGPNGSSTSIEFVWDAVVDAISYDVSIDGGAATNQTDLSVLLTGLNAGDSRFIEVTAISNNECPSITDTLTCFATECPIANFTGPTELCITDSLVLDFVGVSHDDIFWDTGDAMVDGVSTADKKILRWATPGVYTVYLKTDKSDCPEVVYESTITVAPELEPLTIICESTLNSINFSWNSQTCVTNYEVFINGSSVGTTTDDFYLADNLTEGDELDITVVGMSDCICGDVQASETCEAQACAEIGITINLPVDEYCFGDNDQVITVTADIAGDGSGVSGWGSDDNIISSDGEIDLNNLTPGLYEFTYFYDLDNCAYSKKDTIIVHDRPILFVDSEDPDCYLDNTGSVTFSATSSDAVTIKLDGEIVANPDSRSGLIPGPHNVLAETNFGCAEDTLFNIIAAIKPDLQIVGVSVLPIGGSQDLTYTGVNDIIGLIDSVQWTSSEGVLCNDGLCESLTILPVVEDEYCVKIYYNNGCEVEDCFRVRLEQLEITIVNSFTPDSEDGNQVFNVSFLNTGQELKSMKIFDRWGSEMFTTDEIVQNQASWDGKFKGEIVNPAVYVYVIETVLENGRTKLYTGDISVIK